jgi:hypothetical protein
MHEKFIIALRALFEKHKENPMIFQHRCKLGFSNNVILHGVPSSPKRQPRELRFMVIYLYISYRIALSLISAAIFQKLRAVATALS